MVMETRISTVLALRKSWAGHPPAGVFAVQALWPGAASLKVGGEFFFSSLQGPSVYLEPDCLTQCSINSMGTGLLTADTWNLRKNGAHS